MTLRMVLARVGAGKTEAVQEAIAAVKRRDPMAKVWVLLASDRQITAFRHRLMAREPDRHVYVNIEFFSFYNLYSHLLTKAGRPQRCLDESARYGLIRAVCAAEDLRVYRRIAHTSGFIRIMAEFIYELKQNLIFPEALFNAASSDKERELALIYAGYQRLLQQHNLVDREGQGWLALEALGDLPHLGSDIGLLLVDGYDQFNVLQAELLAQLGARTGEALVTLTSVPGREETIGRRFTRAQQRLRDVHARQGVPLEEEERQGYSDTRHPMLRHLSQHIFLPRAPVYEPHPSTSSPLNGEGELREAAAGYRQQGEVSPAIHLLEVPDMPREVGAMLRRVKALLLDGCPPDDILIALRDWTAYGDYFAAQGRMYDLPLALHYGEPLAQNPAVVALMDLLALHAADFRRRELLDVLRSPYFAIPGFDESRVDLLDRLSMTMMVTGGAQTWREALDAAKTAGRSPSDDDETPPSPFDAELVEDTRQALTAFFDAVTPPAEGSTETYLLWLGELIGRDAPESDEDGDDAEVAPPYTLNLIAQARADAPPGIVERDLAALSELVAGLRGMLSAAALFDTLGYRQRLTWADFYSELKTIVGSVSVHRGTQRDGRVMVTTVTDARGLPHQHLFILGLSEGVFPMPVPEDPLLLDTERQALASSGIELSTQAERADDDGLFYELLNQAHESLTLSRPYTRDGSPWPESHLWRAVRALFPDRPVERLKVGAVVPAAEVATVQEVALAATDGAADLHDWLRDTHTDYWESITLGHTIEMGRISRQPYDHYAGRLRDEALIARAAEVLSPNRLWSATQLGEYGTCGFQFFARRLLRLEALREPEDGMDILQLGTLNHEILEATYKALAEAGITITPEQTDFALGVLREKAAGLLANAPQRLGFRASALWEQEKEALLRRIEALVRLDFSGSSPLDKAFPGGSRRPAYFELTFGLDSPLEIQLDDERLRVTGKIDRVDWQNNRAVIIDYKTGSTKIPTDEIKRGRNFQMMLYLLAAQALLDADEIGGAFVHLSSREISGTMLTSSDEDRDVIATAKEHISRNLARGRAGDFATQANRLEDGRCARYCDFHQMCRIAITARNKHDI